MVKKVDQDQQHQRGRKFLVRNVPAMSKKLHQNAALSKAKKTQLPKPEPEPVPSNPAAAPPELTQHSASGDAGENPQVPNTDSKWRSPMKRFSGGGEIKGFVYRKMWEVEFSILEEPRGRALLRQLGLEDFYLEPIPSLDKKLCDEFLSSYNHKTSSGFVRGRLVTIEPEVVAAATRLPFGSVRSDDAVIEGLETREPADSEMKKLMMSVKERNSRGLSLDQVGSRLGENSDVVMKIAFMIMIKLLCRRECHHYAAPDVILALHRALTRGIKLRWAEYLTQMMARASKTAKTGCSYQFGEWLSRIIRTSLGVERQMYLEPQVWFRSGTGSSSLQNEMEISSEWEPLPPAPPAPDAGVGEGKSVEDEATVERLQMEIVQLKKKVEEGCSLVSSLVQALMKRDVA